MGGRNPKTDVRFPKGTVSISPYREGLRLRWRMEDKRPELYLPSSITNSSLIAIHIKDVIEKDLISSNFDETLQRYKSLIRQAALNELVVEQQLNPIAFQSGSIKPQIAVVNESKDILKEFDRYLVIKDKVNDTNYYLLTRKVMEKWGSFVLEDVPQLLSKEKWSAKTFNDRKNCLNAFFDWLKRKKKIVDNPLDDVPTKQRDRMHEDREPFTDEEAKQILHALKTDRFKHPFSSSSHSQYYPFVAFLLHVGCRPGEAIGLKVRYVKFDAGHITIGNSLSRTIKGSHSGARVYKSTKNMKVRQIPLDTYLISLLQPLCRGKKNDDYVFLNENGNVIDDKMFLRRVFKPIQEKLHIPYRVLYACRHTFATRAVKLGMKPHEVSFIMGDTLETVLANYFHNNCMPEKLPTAIANTYELLGDDQKRVA